MNPGVTDFSPMETAVNGSILHGNKPTGADGQSRPALAQPVASAHVIHGLVAIANGPDYCLCGLTWPCAQRAAEPVFN